MGTLSMALLAGTTSPQSNFNSRNYNSGIGGGGFSRGFLNYLADARAMKLREKEAGIGLTGAQTGKIGAETADIYGMTAPSQMKMNLMGSQIDETYGRTAPSMANMYATYAGARADLMRAGGSRTTTMKNFGPFGGETTTTSPNLYFSNPMAGGGGGGFPMAGGGGGGGGFPMAGGGGGGFPMAGGGGFPMAGGGGGGFNTPTGGLTAQSIFDAYEKAQKAKATVEEGRNMIAAKYGEQLDRRGNRLPYNYFMG
jgi:hypothetical protein